MCIVYFNFAPEPTQNDLMPQWDEHSAQDLVLKAGGKYGQDSEDTQRSFQQLCLQQPSTPIKHNSHSNSQTRHTVGNRKKKRNRKNPYPTPGQDLFSDSEQTLKIFPLLFRRNPATIFMRVFPHRAPEMRGRTAADRAPADRAPADTEGGRLLTEHLRIQREDGCWEEPQWTRLRSPSADYTGGTMQCHEHRAEYWDSGQQSPAKQGSSIALFSALSIKPWAFMVTGWLWRYMPGQNKHFCQKKKKIWIKTWIFFKIKVYVLVCVCVYVHVYGSQKRVL